MSRIPMLQPGDLDADQQRVAAKIAGGKRGALKGGPLLAWLHSPELADRAQTLGAYCRYDSSLPPRLSELAILVTARHWQAGYEWQAHAPEALRGGLAAHTVESIRLGQPPAFEHDDEAAVHAFAVELIERREVSDATWATAVQCIGMRGVVDLIAVLGYYGLISMTIKAGRIGVPEFDHHLP